MKKKIVALCMASLMAVGFLSAVPPVQGYAESPGVTSPTKDDMEKVLLAVKKKISIPAEFTEFNYHFSAGRGSREARWLFYWNTKDERNIEIGCDIEGNVLEYSFSENKKGDFKPTSLRSEVEDKAAAFLKKTAPDISKAVRPLKGQDVSVYQGLYYFNYVRVHNGIDMPDNTVSIGVNYETGKVMYYRADWNYGLDFPVAKAALTPQDAAKKIGSKDKMLLTYQTAYGEDGSRRAYLVYQPSLGYISVDANTGEVYLSRDRWEDSYGEPSDEAAAGGNMSKDEGGESQLTEEELKRIKEMDEFLTQEEAVALLKKQDGFYLDSAAKAATASLSKYYGVEKGISYVWNIRLYDPKEDMKADALEAYRAAAMATMDAKTGKIMSFYSNLPTEFNGSDGTWQDVKINYTKTQCRDIFESVVKGLDSSRFSQVKLSKESVDYVAAYQKEKPVYGGYSYSYNRINEGVPYVDNGIYGAVDSVTGKVYQYSMDWDGAVRFESAKGVMSAEKAFDTFIALEGYGLYYELNQIHTEKDNAYSVKAQVRLVYRPDIYPVGISPFSGKQLDYDGEEHTKPGVFTYSDIGSSQYKRDIMLLADLGYGLEGSKFMPDQAVTAKEAEQLLGVLRPEYNVHSDVKELSGTVTQLSLVKRVITILGLDRVASLGGIYVTYYKNDSEIAAKDKGFVALAQGLGMLPAANKIESFRPEEKVSREKAAHLIIQAFKAGSIYE